MSTAPVRIRPPHDHTGLLMLWGLIGLSGLVMPVALEGLASWLAPLLSRVWPGMAWRVVPATILILFAVPLALPGLYMARCCQHRRVVFASGALLGTVYTACFFVVQVVRGGGWPPGSHYIVLALLFMATVVGGVFLLLLAFYRQYIGRLVIYDGTQCVGCGYSVGYVDSASCPECGLDRSTPMKPFGRIYRTAQWLQRHWQLFVGVVVVAATTAGTGLLAWTWPAWRTASAVHATSEYALGFGQRSYIIEIPDDGRSITLDLDYTNPFADPRMTLRLTTPVSSGAATWHAEGPLRIHARLAADHVRAVLEQGLPASLIRAMVDTADRAGWTAPAAALPSRIIEVDPDAHFPIEPVQ